MNEITYSLFDTFALRIPLLPVSVARKIFASDSTSEDIFEYFRNPSIQEAIYLATPDLFNELSESQNSVPPGKVVESFIKYLIRMSTRSTPFGLFAGTSTGVWGNGTNINTCNRDILHKYARLDQNFLYTLIQHINSNHEIRNLIHYFPNSSIYKFGDQLRYVEYTYKNNFRFHKISSVSNNEYLEKIIEAARQGITISQITELIVNEDISREEAVDFIDELIESQILISEIEPCVTGKELLDQIIELTKDLPPCNDIYNLLNKIHKTLGKITNTHSSKAITFYNEIEDDIKETGINYSKKFLFQVDMVNQMDECVLDKDLVHQLTEGVKVLQRLTIPVRNQDMKKFCEVFYERYETQPIELLTALDSECGIGYPVNSSPGDFSELIENLIFTPPSSSVKNITWTRSLAFIHKKLLTAIENKSYMLEILPEEISNMNPLVEIESETFSSIIKIGKDASGTAKILIEHTGGSSAANLLGRFCYCSSSIRDMVKEILEYEEIATGGKLLCEVVHLPESRTGNILQRPILRSYEIPYLGKSSMDLDRQIPVQDLLLKAYSPEKIILISKTLQKEIIPRLSTAHNYSVNSLPVYHFLCDLQNESGLGYSFEWGELGFEFPFLPRVTYKNLIFSLATWNVKKEELREILEAKNFESVKENLARWRSSRNIPFEVTPPEGDNVLYLNFQNDFCIRIFMSMIKNKEFFQLREFFYSDLQPVTKDAEGNYFVNEFVVAFHKEKR